MHLFTEPPFELAPVQRSLTELRKQLCATSAHVSALRRKQVAGSVALRVSTCAASSAHADRRDAPRVEAPLRHKQRAASAETDRCFGRARQRAAAGCTRSRSARASLASRGGGVSGGRRRPPGPLPPPDEWRTRSACSAGSVVSGDKPPMTSELSESERMILVRNFKALTR